MEVHSTNKDTVGTREVVLRGGPLPVYNELMSFKSDLRDALLPFAL